MSIYTYVVDHGDEAPTIKAGSSINGGKCIGVAFEDLQAKADLMEEKLNRIKYRDIDCDRYCGSSDFVDEILNCNNLEELEALDE